MRECLGIMLMESDEGVAVELFQKPHSAEQAFEQLVGKPGDKPSRATFFVVDWKQQAVTDFKTKELPIVRDPDKEPWGHRVGVGPMEKPKESKDDC